MDKLYGGVEAGGTKFVCIAARGPQDILAEEKFPTTTPAETIERVVRFFLPFRESLAAVGVASFGPVDLDPSSPTYGYITTTPKPGWGMADLRGGLVQALQVPVAWDTDVNGAALGEQRWIPANQGLDPFVYITVGTGIGVGVIINGRPLHGLVHPEGGHMALPHDRAEDPFEGACPFHQDCWEGLASGPAMAKRWGRSAETLAADHPAWELEAKYLARAIANLVCVYSPQRIVLGGGVTQHPGLLDRVRRLTVEQLNGYVQSERLLRHTDRYIVPPALGSRSGSLGAVAMAIDAVL